MPVSCAAFGCTNRWSKDKKRQFHRFPLNDSKRLKLWLYAIRRKSFQPTKYTLICSDHFTVDSYKSESKRYLKDDAVPTIFKFSKNFQTAENNRRSIIIKHSLPISTENVCEKQNRTASVSTVRNMKLIRIKKNIPASTNEVSQTDADLYEYVNSMFECDKNDLVRISVSSLKNCENTRPLNQDSSVVTSNDSTHSVESYVSAIDYKTMTPESTIEDDVSINAKPFVVSSKNLEGLIVKRSIPTTKNISHLNPEPSIVNSESLTVNIGPSVLTENTASPNIDVTKCRSKDVIKETTVPTLKPIEDTSESDYSYFKSNPLDTKEVLAVKLETMLAVNLALQEKVKFYRNRCKFFERKINNLTSKRKFKFNPVRYKSL